MWFKYAAVPCSNTSPLAPIGQDVAGTAHLRMQAALGLDEADALHLLIHRQQVEAPVPAPDTADAGDHSARRLARVLQELHAQLLTSSPPGPFGDARCRVRAQGIASGSSKIDVPVRNSVRYSSV